MLGRMSAGADVYEVDEISGCDVDGIHGELLRIYAVCYSGPPWYETAEDVEVYADRIRDWAGLDSFAGLVARDASGSLVGATYGWSGPAEVRGMPLPGIEAANPFNVADLMVHPTVQRRGLGRALLDRLVEGRAPAVLLTHPDGEARHLYEAARWRCVGSVTPSESMEWLVYLHEV